MLNTVRVNEIRMEIQKIEMDREETELFIKKLTKDEESCCEQLRSYLTGVHNDIEVWQGNARMTELMEERLSLLQEAESDSEKFISDLHESRKKIETKCDTDISKLKREMKQLEMI